MEGKKISECGGYKKVHCLDNIVGSGYELNNGSVYPVYEGTCGVYLYVNGHKIYTTSARFVEHVEEVQLSEPDYAPLTASDGVMVKRSVYDDLIRAGWTDELLIDDGYIVPPQEPKPSPWNTQVGGSHYTEKAMQPLQLTLVNKGYNAFSGACYTKINKYTTRAKDNEVEQLKKARHVLDLWIYEAEKQADES